ncbi:MAG TPA: hypothetical protein VMN60_01480 [Longimicrobiales bacterium]|nr:hypothetical protein [Longimicrobiales bacterium]
MKKALIAATLVPLLLHAACQDKDLPTAVLPGVYPSFDISDGANQGNRHFFFLPPMVAAPRYSGDFDGSLSPRVEICRGTAAPCASSDLVATFTTTTGPGSETIRVETASEEYVVNWHTDQFALTLDQTYRIRTLVAGTQLGYADVKIYGNGKAANGSTSTDIALVDGRTLPIKFRIELGAVYVVQPPQAGDPPAVVTSIDGSVQMSLPEGSISEPVGITIEPTLPPPDQTDGVIAGTTFDFGPDGTQFGTPITVNIQYDPAQLPPDRSEESLRLATLVNGRWEWVRGSRVDPATNAVTAELEHFSTYTVRAAKRVAATIAPGEPSTRRAGPSEIITFYEDGSGIRRLGMGRLPVWSPTQNEIAYLGCDKWSGSQSLCVISPDATCSDAITEPVGGPTYDDDGFQITFPSESNPCLDSGEAEILGHGLTYWEESDRVQWSPDGTRLAFSLRNPNQLFVLSRSAPGRGPGSSLRDIGEMIFDPAPWGQGWWAGAPSWSPDGTQLVVAGGPPIADYDGNAIYRMNIDGTNVIQLTDASVYRWNPVWALDGSIVYTEHDSGIGEDPFWDGATRIQRINPASGAIAPVVSGLYSTLWAQPYDLVPTLHPSGDQVVFHSYGPTWEVGERASIWVARIDGSGLTELATSAILDVLPSSGLPLQFLAGVSFEP